MEPYTRFSPYGVREMPLPLGLGTVYLKGGPFDQSSDEALKVCLKETLPEGTEDAVHVPIPDFSVPPDKHLVYEALSKTLTALAFGHPVFVGCAGGRGRTGLFLALLVKAVGVPDPVGYVRRTYNPHAVETAQQKRYVEEFDILPLWGVVTFSLCYNSLRTLARKFW